MQKSYRYCFQTKKLVPITIENDQNHVIPAKNVKIENIQFNDDGNVRVETKTASIYGEFNRFFENIPNRLSALNLTHSKYISIIDLLNEMLRQSEHLCAKISEHSNDACAHKTGIEYVLKKLKKIDTNYKLKKIIKSHPMYVKPVELAVDLKWKKPKINDKTQIPSHSITQTTYQFVSPIETLLASFSNEDFKSSYLEYNLKDKHVCKDNEYRDFCCGSVCKSKKIFEDPLSLKIQLGTDDFEICCPLKSKATVHKICATYMQIRNMPIEYRSKLDSIHLVALCESSNIKPSDITYDFIAKKIVNEIRVLERDGINVGGQIIKGSVSDVAADNLGANNIFGYTECFVASYSCRHCECSKEECHVKTAEIKSKMRTQRSYNKCVEAAENSQKLDLKMTKGIKRSCNFNNLEYYHVIDNVSVDLMHDFNEGVVSYALHDFFEHIIKKRILSLGEIQSRVRDFCYSIVHKYNTPSLISVEKNHLNQNASQIYCLMIHIPFIFYDIREKILEYWPPIQTLLGCMQIVYSDSITESEIKTLERRVSSHLKCVREVNERSLTMKHHFMLHYPNSIRKMGPPIKSWTMLIEAKHKVFTEIAKSKKNFKNTCKTVANCHQDRACKYPSLKARTVPSVKYSNFMKTMEFKKYEKIIAENVAPDSVISLHVHNFFKYDYIVYRVGNFIIFNDQLCRILHIISNGPKILLIVSIYYVIREDDFCLSLIVDTSNENTIFDFELLVDKKVYYHVYLNGQVHIIANILSVARISK